MVPDIPPHPLYLYLCVTELIICFSPKEYGKGGKILKMQLRSLFSWLWRETIPGGSDLVRKSYQSFPERRDSKQQILSPVGLKEAVTMRTAFVEEKPPGLRAEGLSSPAATKWISLITWKVKKRIPNSTGEHNPRDNFIVASVRSWEEDPPKVCPHSWPIGIER